MDNLAVVLVVFAVGILVGLALSLALAPARRQYKRLQEERDEAVSSLSRYREEVDHHFLKTAELVNQLTASYRSVHEHLAGGARRLCSEEGRRQAITRSLDRPPEEDASAEPAEAPTGPPLDYAPSARGTLSEDFGLRREYDAEGPFTPVEDLLAERARKEGEPQADVTPPRDYAEGDAEPGLSTGEDEPRKA